MNRSIHIVSFLVLVSGIISCKKNKDSNANADPNKTRISRMMQWNTGSPSKKILITEFVYDDQKRLTELASYYADSAGNDIKITSKDRSLQIFYNGNEKNPYKTFGALWSNPNIGMITEMYHSYNSSGALVQDSLPASSTNGIKTIRKYNYYTDKIIIGINDRKDSVVLADHNIKEYYFLNPYNTPYGYKISYDNRINPISKLNVASLLTANALYGFPSYLAPGYCKNNIIEAAQGNVYTPGQFTATSQWFYTFAYNSNNLPETCNFTNVSGNYYIKFEYIDQ